MKPITYLATWQSRAGHTNEDKITVTARSINSGFTKAARLATQGLPAGAEIVSLAFWSA